jgi:hypothetical protein
MSPVNFKMGLGIVIREEVKCRLHFLVIYAKIPQTPKACPSCTVDIDSQTVCMCINQTGIVVTTAEQ